MRVLEGRAEALAGTFNAQEVAKMLWAYATMGRESGAGLMRVLEGRAEALAGTFKAQHVDGIPRLWAAILVLHRQPHVARPRTPSDMFLLKTACR
jgi:hypothetical protein